MFIWGRQVQAYFGTPNLDALRAADRLRAYNEGGYALLRAFLDGSAHVDERFVLALRQIAVRYLDSTIHNEVF